VDITQIIALFMVAVIIGVLWFSISHLNKAAAMNMHRRHDDIGL